MALCPFVQRRTFLLGVPGRTAPTVIADALVSIDIPSQAAVTRCRRQPAAYGTWSAPRLHSPHDLTTVAATLVSNARTARAVF